jgi:acetyl esterase/lipase
MAIESFDSTQSAAGYVDPARQKTTAEDLPLPKKRLSLLHRVNCFVRLWLLKSIARTFFIVARFFFRPNAINRPTLTKRYPCRPSLETRIFFPPDYYARSTPGLLPLYVDIHGGGFALCDAQFDDRFCVSWAKRTGMLVVSLNYRKAPLHPFPTATHDIAAIVRAVLEDELLPIDKSRVAIGGFSAGGNLALSAAQLPGLKGIIKATVAYYPVVDFGYPANVKLAARPYTDGPRDALEHSAWFFDWGYVSPGQNRRDPLLSPCYAKPEDLPSWIYIIGAQWDMLRLEAQLMMHRLAGLDDRVEHLKTSFEKGNYKWTLATGCSHGFTHGLGDLGDVTVPKEIREKIYQEAHDWLKKSVLSDASTKEVERT